MDLLTGGLSLFGGLSGMFGSGPGTLSNIPNLPTIDTGPAIGGAQNAINQQGGFNLGGQNYGQYAGQLQRAINNPFGGGAIGSAQGFGGLGMGNALGGLGTASMLGSQVPAMLGGANALMTNAFDPQNALYNRTAQQVSDQTGAYLANSGVGNTPYGAGVFGQNMNNFNIDWQNNLLQREIAGSGAAGGLWQGAGNLGTGAFNLGANAAQSGSGFGSLPWQTYNNVNAQPLSLLSQGSQYGQNAAAIPQQQAGDWLQYLQAATGANQAATTAAMDQIKASQQFGQNIGSGLQGIGQGIGDLMGLFI
jgi:hypothetical protein